MTRGQPDARQYGGDATARHATAIKPWWERVERAAGKTKHPGSKKRRVPKRKR